MEHAVNVQQNSNQNMIYWGMQLPPFQLGDTARAGMAVAQIPDLKSWEVSANVGGTASNMTCTFTQKDTDLTGSCETDQAPYEVAGKVDGKTVTWQFKTEYEGQTLTVVYSGTLDSPDKFAGTVDVQPLGVSGDFNATRAK